MEPMVWTMKQDAETGEDYVEIVIDTALRRRWLAAMRSSTVRAIGRECDFAMSEGDVDKFDPIGLLAMLAGAEHDDADFYFTHLPGQDGTVLNRLDAEWLAKCVGFPPERLYDLCLMNDAGMSWGEMADWVEAQ